MVGAGLRKIIETRACSLDDVVGDERRALGRSLLGALDTAFPFEDGPAVEAVLRQFGKDSSEVHLPIAGRAKTPGAIDPWLISAVNALAPAGTKFRVFHVKHLDALVVEIEVLQVIELLENKVTGIEEDVAAGMIACALEKHFKGYAIVQVFAGMNLEAKVHSRGVERVQDGLPARGQFVERGFDQSRRALRPGVHVGPSERAGKCGMGAQAQIC